MKRDLTETIKDSDLVHWMAGGIDLSLNDDTQRNLPICWQAQLYGFAEVSNREAILQVAAGYVQQNPQGEAPFQTEGMRRLISGNFLRLQN